MVRMDENKRFIIDKRARLEKPYAIRDYGELINQEEICELLNELHDKYIDEYALRETLQLDLQRVEEENKELKEENEQLKDALNQRTNQCDKYYKENEQLKQRNDRQAKRLAELYELMAKKDWESLTEIIDDFCSCEEQLQRESGTYSDWND